MKVHNKLVQKAFNKRTDKDVAEKILKSIKHDETITKYDVLKSQGIIKQE